MKGLGKAYRFAFVAVFSLFDGREPELGEGESAEDISQYPLEDIASLKVAE